MLNPNSIFPSAMSLKEKKVNANAFGNFAEDTAAQSYIKQGYVILERKWRMGKIEIDLIARKEDVVVFIEVKARKSGEREALQAVDKDKRKRMIRAADSYLQRIEGNVSYRFDIVTCVGDQNSYKLEIYKDAFLAADLF